MKELPLRLFDIFRFLSIAQNMVNLFPSELLTECKERRLIVIMNLVRIQMSEQLTHRIVVVVGIK